MSDRARNRLNIIATIVTWVALGAGVVYGYATDRSATSTIARQAADHEERIRAIERMLPQIASDVRVIRYAVEGSDREDRP